METRIGWYSRCRRWGQVNLREIDPPLTDVSWWVEVFRRTRIDGLTVNAGGIIAYYPTRIPGHWRSRWLGDRDLFGEFVAAAKGLGLYVLGRMDCAGVHRDFAYSHPDWLMVDKEGRPYQYRDVELYYTCPNSPYYRQYIPDIFREVLNTYDIDGFFDNGWPSLGRREAICHCVHCQRAFRQATGFPVPDREDWDDPLFRQWVAWRYQVMEEVWDYFNAVVRAIKPWAIWVGNLYGHDFGNAPNRGVDWLNLARHAAMFGLDHQGRALTVPVFSVGEFGRLLRNVAEGKPFYNLYGTWYAHTPPKRTLAKPAAELTLWLAEAVASGFRPWWHSIGAANPDRRWVPAVAEFFQWHAQNEQYLLDRASLAETALVFSQRTLDYYGREAPDERVSRHLHGWALALLKARIPFDIVHERKLSPPELTQYRLLILANAAALSDEAITHLRAFVERGGSLIATFESTLYDEWGQPRDDYALADLLGIHRSGLPLGPLGHAFQQVRRFDHPIVAWVRDTDYLACNGRLCPVTTEPDVQTLATLIPPYPIYPPEFTFPEVRETVRPTLLVRERGASRLVYFPSDIDRELWDHNFPEFARLLGEAARWALGQPPVVRVEGPGLLDVQPYRQGEAIIVHLVNLTQAHLWRAPLDEITPVPGQRLQVRWPAGQPVRSVRLLVAGREADWQVEGETVTVRVPEIGAHEVVVIQGG
jgi:hypothetical protein